MKKTLLFVFLLTIACALSAESALISRLRLRSESNRSQLNAYIQKINPNLKSSSVDGDWELVGLDEGRPVYYCTNNLATAWTISTDNVWPGGVDGLSLSGNNGVNLGLWDSGGVRSTHVELTGRVAQIDNPSALANHSTHCAGTLISAGNTYWYTKGMSYQGTLSAFEWNDDHLEMAQQAENGMLISSHSYGTLSGWANGTYYGGQTSYPHWFGAFNEREDFSFGKYDEEAGIWDDIIYDNPYYLIVNSAGNDRDDAAPVVGTVYYRLDESTEGWVQMTMDENGPYNDFFKNGFNTIPTKGNAKNIITIGSVEDIESGYSSPSDVVIAPYSSWGPTDDGRIKPDIVANGQGVWSTGAGSDNETLQYGGTSMAAPSVAGSLNLIQQHYHNLYNAWLKSATLKALVIHTADEAGSNPGPDYSYGWGLMNTSKAAQVISDNQINQHVFETLLPNNSLQGREFYCDGTSDIRTTICWTDPAAEADDWYQEYTDPKLINDLDIILIGPDGTEYFPWTLDPLNPSAPAQNNTDNTLDNVEQIFISNPVPGEYVLYISHKDELYNSMSQNYSLIITGMVTSKMGSYGNNVIQEDTQTIIDAQLICNVNGIVDWTVSDPAHGEVEIILSRPAYQLRIQYTPDPDFYGEDTFNVTAYENDIIINSLPITIYVNPVNDFAVNTSQNPIIEGNPFPGEMLTINPGNWNDNTDTQYAYLDTHVSVIYYYYQWQYGMLVNGVFTWSIATGEINNFFEPDTSYCDLYLRCEVTVGNQGIGSPEVIEQIFYTEPVLVTCDEDQPLIIIVDNGTNQDTNEDIPLEFTVHALSDNSTTFNWFYSSPIWGFLEFVDDNHYGDTRIIRFTPNLDYNGYDSFVIAVFDDLGQTFYQPISMLTHPINDTPQNTVPPVISGDFLPGTEAFVQPGEWNDIKDNQFAQEEYQSTIVTTYQWQLAEVAETPVWQDIADAIAMQYLLPETNNSYLLRCMVTATDDGVGELGRSSTSASIPSNEVLVEPVAAPDNQIPEINVISKIYPNPFQSANASARSEAAKVLLALKADAHISVELYNLKGQKIRNISEQNYPAGYHEISWNGCDNNNSPLSSGVYFINLKVNGQSQAIKKFLILK